MQVDGITIDSD